MKPLRLELIVALSQNRVIGRDNQLPWHLPDDLKFFKKTTLGLPVLMGRKTYESIGKPLPGRLNVVISRETRFSGDQLVSFASIDEALADLSSRDQVERVVIIGGAQIFAALLDRVSVLYLTEVLAVVEGDVYFPDFDPAQWTIDWQEEHTADERHAYPFRFIKLLRKAEPAQ